MFALIMGAVSISETSVNFCETIQRNIAEDSHLHIHRRENLKSHLKIRDFENSSDECNGYVTRNVYSYPTHCPSKMRTIHTSF
jgi:hypothetical protein